MAVTKITGAGLGLPNADGNALGGASNEWSDLYLADSGVIYFGNDQDVTITHDPDDGLFLKSTATADDNPFLLTLQTGETDLAADDVIGKIAFQAPDEGTGTDAILVSAAIQARAEGNHSSSSNATSLDFLTGASEAAAKKMSVTSGGDVNVLTDGASVFFGADSEIELRHVADDGLILKHVGTGDGKEPSLTFQAGDNDIAANDVLGSIFFQAPDEGTGTDAVLVAAGIEAVSEGDFSSSNNATKLSFKTGASEAATEKMSLSSAGILTISDDLIIGDGKTIGSASDVDAMTIAAGGAVTFSQVPVFPNNTVETADIQDNAVTLAKMAGGTDGNIISFDASGDPVAIATGTDGQVLTSTGAGSPPAFEAIPASGKVLQVVQDSVASGATTTSTTYTTTGLDVDITPASSTNKVFVMVNAQMGQNGPQQAVALYRGTTNIMDNSRSFNASGHTSGDVNGALWNISLAWLDSPSSTTAVTYKLMYKVSSATGYFNRSAGHSDRGGYATITAIEIDA